MDEKNNIPEQSVCENDSTEKQKRTKATIRSAITTILLAIIVFFVAYTFFTYLMV